MLSITLYFAAKKWHYEAAPLFYFFNIIYLTRLVNGLTDSGEEENLLCPKVSKETQSVCYYDSLCTKLSNVHF